MSLAKAHGMGSPLLAVTTAVVFGGAVGMLWAWCAARPRHGAMSSGLITGMMGAMASLWLLDLLGVPVRSPLHGVAAGALGASSLIALLNALRPPRLSDR